MNRPQQKTAAVSFTPGQRWISTSEPELGLGVVTSFANRRIELYFDTHATSRTFAIDSAPLQRIVFTPGNTIEDCSGGRFTVTAVSEDPATGLVTYECGKQRIREDELSDTLSFSTPDQRLMAGIADDVTAFSLRESMLEHRAAIEASPVLGFCGGRIDLIGHQLYIAQQASSRSAVRILLADETGLGKTIEACLILHRLIATGQVTRALILVPDALVHQWFVELLRRFNLLFRLFSDELFEEYDDEEGETGFFDDDTLWICSIAMLRRHQRYAEEMLSTSWDLVIVDEAHHITVQDPFFKVLSSLAGTSPSMILLSATPEQFGRKGHLARLHLLDPQRYGEPEDPAVESRKLQLIASCIGKQMKLSDEPLTPESAIALSPKLRSFLSERQHSEKSGNEVSAIPDSLTIGRLIDLFGVGRAYFRNTRKTITGFPRRTADLIRLSQSIDIGNLYADWISGFLKKYARRKTLVITSTIENVLQLRDAIQKLTAADVAVFHEAMTLIQRDRQAAWFAEDHGARLLICSESGSEGRNFQFCSDLILLDVPWNPELLEQRIGRLDRIGQKNAIRIHVPVIENTREDILCTWYHEGVSVFEKNVPAAAVVFEEMKPVLEQLAENSFTGSKISSTAFRDLVTATVARTAELSRELYDHRDYLLEFASNNAIQANTLIAAIEAESTDSRAEKIMTPLFNHYGIKLEEAGSGRMALITEYCTDHSFPLPRAERPVITYDRTTAFTYDTTEFLTIDHPMVSGALDLFLSSPHGTTSFALWNDSTTTEVLLESLHVVECIAPASLRLFRFFTPDPVRTVVNHHCLLVTDHYPRAVLAANCKNGPVNKLVAQKQLIFGTFPKLVAASDSFCTGLARPLIEDAKEKMHAHYRTERDRLLLLRAQGASVTDGELADLDREEQDSDKYLTGTRIRRDALRLIWRGAVRGE